jgi:primosomal protein N' (replication factor Y)
VLHSGLTDRDRADAWAALRQGKIVLAIGARSALFAPMPNLGAIVVDEEHDPSFKQEEGFRYHARDMAMLRARDAGAVCVLGSATPAVETRYLADQGRIRRLELRLRATGQSLPTVEIVDLARHRSGPFGSSLLSAPLVRAMERTLASGDQTILFLNRRGFAPSVRCEAVRRGMPSAPRAAWRSHCIAVASAAPLPLLRLHATPIQRKCAATCGQPDLR